MGKYSAEFRAEMVRKLLMPGGPRAADLARETGVAPWTLSRWKREHGRDSAMKGKPRTGKEWSETEKVQAVLETHALGEKELGAYLRRKGLHSADLERWKCEILEDAQGRGRGRPKKDAEVYEQRKRIKELERELRRKDKALAEATALLVLKKKVALIWGAKEDDESE